MRLQNSVKWHRTLNYKVSAWASGSLSRFRIASQDIPVWHPFMAAFWEPFSIIQKQILQSQMSYLLQSYWVKESVYVTSSGILWENKVQTESKKKNQTDSQDRKNNHIKVKEWRNTADTCWRKAGERQTISQWWLAATFSGTTCLLWYQFCFKSETKPHFLFKLLK